MPPAPLGWYFYIKSKHFYQYLKKALGLHKTLFQVLQEYFKSTKSLFQDNAKASSFWNVSIFFCQTPGLGLRLGVDFVFPLSQEQEQQQQEQQLPPKSKLEFDTKDQVLLFLFLQLRL